MKRALIASAIAIVFSQQALAPALAQTVGPTPKQLLHDLQRAASPQPLRRVAPISRSAALKLTGTVVLNGSIAQPLFCTIGFYSYGSGDQGYSEEKTLSATVSGDTATCNVYVPFKWSNIDPSTQISPHVTVSSVLPQNIDNAAVAGSAPERTSEFSLGLLPLPAENTVTTVTFAIKM